MSKKKIVLIAVFVVMMIIVGSVCKVYCFPSIPKMFKMNKQLQEEGYYMAEFEFKMLGIVYNLDHGKFIKAYSQLTKLNKQMKTREGLVKLPQFANKQEEIDFYLNQQNPETGAFMDDSYPFCTFTGPTGNVLYHLDFLAQETGQPLKLKYPLKYMEKINTPEKLRAYLDDVATVGWIGSRFPQTSFHFARCLFSLVFEDSIVEKHGIYQFDPEWKMALLQWFYDNQDPETGLWGPKSKSGKLRKKDTMNTASILKNFIDDEGNDRYEQFPLRYRNELALSYLEKTSESIPADDELDDWHEWQLDNAKSIKTLLKLWSGFTPETRDKVAAYIEHYYEVIYEKFYIEKERAFSYYPGSDLATLDGTSGISGLLNRIGAFSIEKQRKVWGETENYCNDAGISNVSEITEADLATIKENTNVNSVRFYALAPDSVNYTDNVLGVFYPRQPVILDVTEVIPGLLAWVNNTQQSMGNWVSREDLTQELSNLAIKEVPVFKNEFPLVELNDTLKNSGKVILIGFDQLQKPSWKGEFQMISEESKNGR